MLSKIGKIAVWLYTDVTFGSFAVSQSGYQGLLHTEPAASGSLELDYPTEASVMLGIVSALITDMAAGNGKSDCYISELH